MQFKVLPRSELEQLYVNEKLPHIVIAEKLGVDRHTVIDHLHAYQIPMRYPYRFKLNIDMKKMVDMYVNQKMSCVDIAKRFGCSKQTIRYRLLLCGVKLRRNSEASELAVWKWWSRAVEGGKKSSGNHMYDTHYYCMFCNRWVEHSKAWYNKRGAPICACGHKMRTKRRSRRKTYKRIYPNGPKPPAWAKL